MTFELKFTAINHGSYTTEFMNFDPFSESKENIEDLMHMLNKTYQALAVIDEYFELLEEVDENVFKIEG